MATSSLYVTDGVPRCQPNDLSRSPVVLDQNSTIVVVINFVMPQATWRGFLRLSVVTCPVYVSPATARTKPIRLHQVWQPASVDVDEDELLPPRPPPGPTRVYSCNSMCTERGRDAGREDPRSDDQYSRVTAADRQQRAERARGDPHSADRIVARGQGRPARGQDAQPGTAFRRYAEKLLR